MGFLLVLMGVGAIIYVAIFGIVLLGNLALGLASAWLSALHSVFLKPMFADKRVDRLAETLLLALCLFVAFILWATHMDMFANPEYPSAHRAVAVCLAISLLGAQLVFLRLVIGLMRDLFGAVAARLASTQR